MTFDRQIPFNDLPALPPKEDLETKKVLKKAIGASRALSKLNGAIVNLPNPHLFLDTIHLIEAKASSEIENIVTTNDDLYKSLVAEKAFTNPAVKEVLNYKEALWRALEKLDSLPFITTNLCIEIVQTIKQNTAGIRNTPGTKLANAKGEVIYTPPSGEGVIASKMADLEKFINDNGSLDPLVKMALIHYQFEAIHPFIDGNGRTGRILLLVYLKLTNLLDVPAIYLSDYIIKHKLEYYRKLRAVTENGAWEEYIMYMLDMVEKTAESSLKRLDKVVALKEEMTEQVRMKLPKAYSHELMEILFRLPYSKRQFLIDAGLGTPKTVGNYLKELEDAGFLSSTKVGKEKLYLNYKLMAILEEH